MKLHMRGIFSTVGEILRLKNLYADSGKLPAVVVMADIVKPIFLTRMCCGGRMAEYFMEKAVKE